MLALAPKSTAIEKKAHGSGRLTKNHAETSKKEIPFLSSIEDMQAMKTDLQTLMTDFKNDRLKSFGTEITRNKMDRIRHLQRSLARLHFDLDNQINYSDGTDSKKMIDKQNENMNELLQNMDVLGSAMLSLNDPVTSRSSEG